MAIATNARRVTAVNRAAIVKRGHMASVSPAAIGMATLTLAMLDASAVWAQSAPAQAAQATSIEEVVVTGTRIVREGFEAPTPMTVVGVEEIQANAPATISDYVNQLPSFGYGQTTHSTGNGGVSGGSKGTSTLNLRGLGANRTLVLLDGVRVAATNLDNSVDTTGFPDSLISRVDVVTGGASAAYGSDALSGVVNFVLNKEFVGLKGAVQGGVTGYGDDRSWKASMTGGTAFGNGRGHLILFGEAGVVDGVGPKEGGIINREWARSGYQIMNNPLYGTTAGLSTSVPRLVAGPQTAPSNASPGGIIVSGPLKGIYFGPGGVPAQFNYGSLVVDPQMRGGMWQYTDTGTVGNLDDNVAKQNLFSRLSYEIADGINVYLLASYGKAHDIHSGNRKGDFGNDIIKADNAFIPATVAAQMAALKLTTITLGTMNGDLPPHLIDNVREQYRYVAGANGRFEAFDTMWSWDAYFQSGIARTAIDYRTEIAQTFRDGIDAVRNANGTIVCRTSLSAPNNGCVPYNLFGQGVNSAAAIDYVVGNAQLRQKMAQKVASVSANGEPFSNWSGPVSLSFGMEHRKESVDGWNDPISEVAGFASGNYNYTRGNYNVTEGFVETVIPLAKDTVWAKVLDLNAAVRFTGYSTSGYVTTWKIGATYNPIDDIRLRATRSRDIRAPGLDDLYSRGTNSTSAFFDALRNVSTPLVISSTTGNPNLKPEEADTLGLGIVLQPRFFPGFNASFDYYDIDIGNAIGAVGSQSVIDRCYLLNQPEYCPNITRDPATQNITRIRSTPFNLVSLKTRGYDIEVGYTTPLSAIADSLSGNLGLRAFITHVSYLKSTDGINPVVNTVGAGGPQHWRYLFTASYNADPVSFTITHRGIGSGNYNNAYIECTSGCPVSTANNLTINTNYVPGAFYTDLSMTYKAMHKDPDGSDVDVFLTIQNLMGKDPPQVAPAATAGGNNYINAPTDGNRYDTLGRVFRLGVRFSM